MKRVSRCDGRGEVGVTGDRAARPVAGVPRAVAAHRAAVRTAVTEFKITPVGYRVQFKCGFKNQNEGVPLKMEVLTVGRRFSLMKIDRHSHTGIGNQVLLCV